MINNLRRRWRDRLDELDRSIPSTRDAGAFVLITRDAKRSAIEQCISELNRAVDASPLTEASTEKLYKWAGRMVQIMDLMINARDGEHCDEIAEELGDLATDDFLDDVYDLFKQLANREVRCK